MKIRPYRNTDNRLISDFMKQYFVDEPEIVIRSQEPEYYAWKYGKNYSGSPVVWIAEEDGQIIGLFGVIPRLFWMRGREWYCGEMVDAFLHPDWQGSGVFWNLVKNVFSQCKNDGMEFLFGSPNKIALLIWIKIYKFSLIFEYRSLIRPLNFDSILFKKIPNKMISGLLGKPISLIYWLIYSRCFNKGFASFEKIDRADQRLDSLWENMKENYPFTVIKRSDYLNWRFVENPDPYDIYLIKVHGVLVGYVVIRIKEIKGYNFGFIVDLMILHHNKKRLKMIVYSMMDLLREQQIDIIASWAIKNNPWFNSLKEFGFFARRKMFWFVIRSEREDQSLLEGMDDVRLWTFSQGDTDNI